MSQAVKNKQIGTLSLAIVLAISGSTIAVLMVQNTCAQNQYTLKRDWEQNLLLCRSLNHAPAEALHFCRLALASSGMIGKSSLETAITLEQMARLQLHLGQTDAAQISAHKSLEIFQSLKQHSSQTRVKLLSSKHVISSMLLLTAIQIRSTDYTQARKNLIPLIKSLSENIDPLSSSWNRLKLEMAIRLDGIACTRLKLEKESRIRALQAQALSLAPGVFSSRLMPALLKNPLRFIDSFSYPEIESSVSKLLIADHFEQAMEIPKRILAECEQNYSPLYESVLIKIASESRKLGKYNDAVSAYQQLYQQTEHNNSRPEAARLFYKSCVLENLILANEWKESKLCLYQIISTLKEKTNSNTEWRNLLVWTAEQAMTIADAGLLDNKSMLDILNTLQEISQKKAQYNLIDDLHSARERYQKLSLASRLHR